MSLYDFQKHVYLPSGGLSYQPHAWIMPCTNEVLFFDHDINNGESRLEYIISFVKKYVQLPVDILEMYVDDIIFIWMNIVSLDLNKDSEITEYSSCIHCGKENELLIDFSQLEFNIINPNNNPLLEHYEFNVNNNIFKIRFRKIKDSLVYSNMSFINLNNEFTREELSKKCILYISPQIESIFSSDGTEINSRDFYDFLINMHSFEIFSLYLKITSLEGKFGVKKRLKFKCTKCSKENNFFMYNDLVYSTMRTKQGNLFNSQRSILRYLLNVSSFHPINLNELTAMPLRYTEVFASVLQNSKVINGSVFTSYNDGMPK